MCTQTCTHTHVHTNIYTCTHVYTHIHTHVHTNMVHACHGTAHTYSMLNVCAHTYIHTQPAHTYIHTQPAVAGRLHCLHIHATVYMLQTCAMMESESTSPGDKAVCEDMQQHLEERDAETLSLTPPQSSVKPTLLTALFPFPHTCQSIPGLNLFCQLVHPAGCQAVPAPICRGPLDNMAASTFAPAVTFTHASQRDVSGKCF